AAVRAGYSEKTAYSIGQNLLKKVEVKNRISELQSKRAERVGITQDEVLSELKNFAFADITQTLLLTTEGVMNLPVEVRRMI
ncbi:terminase small subunit, partial [Lacticaseibacillus paracasei]